MIVILGLLLSALVWSQTSEPAARRAPLIVTYEIIDATQRTWRRTFYYRSDGSVARSILPSGDTAPARTEVIADVRTKRSFLKDPVTKRYVESPLSPESLARRTHVPTSCESATIRADKCHPLGDDQILGYRVQKVTSVVSNKPGWLMESYLAPDLNFVPLLRVGKQGERVTYRMTATSLQRAEPDDAVFALPSDYQDATQSADFFTAGEAARGR